MTPEGRRTLNEPIASMVIGYRLKVPPVRRR